MNDVQMGGVQAVSPAAAAGGPVWWLIALAGAPALVMIAFGLWMVWGGRVAPVGREASGRGIRRWRDAMTEASRLSIGLSAIGLAYHGVSYACPDHWLPFRVPPERWYVVVLFAVLLTGGSLVVDRRLRGNG